jgi:hypothetical protein
VVADGELDLVADVARGDRDRRGAVLDRVLDEVDEHVLEQHRVDRDQQVAGDVDRRPARAEHVREAVERRAAQLLDRDPLAGRLQAGLDARDAEEVLQHALEPGRLVDDRVEQLGARVRRGGRRRRAARSPRP